MVESYFLARAISAYLIVVGLALVLQRKRMVKVAGQVAESYALLAISGVLALVIGLLIINSHNVWSTVWQAIISLLGWIAMINGAVRLLIPEALASFTKKGTGETFFVVSGIILLIIGVYLGYVGFFYHQLYVKLS